jgi:hypothetical protein
MLLAGTPTGAGGLYNYETRFYYPVSRDTLSPELQPNSEQKIDGLHFSPANAMRCCAFAFAILICAFVRSQLNI